jgi:hypothetical protein
MSRSRHLIAAGWICSCATPYGGTEIRSQSQHPERKIPIPILPNRDANLGVAGHGRYAGVNAMNKWILVFAATAIGIAAIPKQAEAQVYVRDGARYCFYYDGWHGPGWYQCGYRWRQGLGWGGVYDWGIGFGWHHGGWERRHGRRHAGDRPRARVYHQSQQGAVIRQQSQQPGVIRGQTTTQDPTIGRATVRSGSAPAIRSGTTGAGQGGLNAAPSVSRGGGGGGSVGGGGALGGSGGGSVSGPGKQ